MGVTKVHKKINKSGAKILIIDDERALCILYRALLTPEGHTVLIANNGQDGIKINEKENPDIIFLDIRMSGMDGLETLRRIRKEDPDVIVIILTGSANPDVVSDAADLDVFQFKSKPISIVTIKNLIKEAVAFKETTK
jgi:DNA-binding NtrC family response regulator